MSNTTVTIKYSSGATREFVASDELEELINEGEMFSVTTMHSDIGPVEEMAVSKMYVGNPMGALGSMMLMKRNAEAMVEMDSSEEQNEHKKMGMFIEAMTVAIGLLSDEITSFQSNMTNPAEGRIDGSS